MRTVTVGEWQQSQEGKAKRGGGSSRRRRSSVAAAAEEEQPMEEWDIDVHQI
jgi:hypothetical protein